MLDREGLPSGAGTRSPRVLAWLEADVGDRQLQVEAGCPLHVQVEPSDYCFTSEDRTRYEEIARSDRADQNEFWRARVQWTIRSCDIVVGGV